MDIPNLFTVSNEAERLYSIMLSRLTMYDAFREIVRASRRIRIHARNSVGEDAAAFTNYFQCDALWYLGCHSANWARQIRYESVIYGRMVDLSSSELSECDIYLIAQQRASILYACGRFTEGRLCKERRLGLSLSFSPSDGFLQEVINDDKEPAHPVRVTLSHIYQALGKSLKEWKDWPRFVNGVPDELLAASSVLRDELRHDPNQLRPLFNTLMDRGRQKNKRERPRIIAPSPWESELQKWFPFLNAYPDPKE